MCSSSSLLLSALSPFGRLGVAYNNAGIRNQLAEPADQALEDYDHVMGVNLQGVWSCMKYELQVMRKQGSGAIVNCSMLRGLIGGPDLWPDRHTQSGRDVAD